MLTLENFRWNILKICSIFLVFVMKAVDQHWILCFCFVFVFLISAILLFQSKAGQNHYHSSGWVGGTSYYTVQPTGMSQSWNHRLQLSFTPHDDYLYSRYCWPPVSLCNSGLLSVLYHLLYLFFQAAVFYNNNKKKKTFEAWLEAAGFSVSGCMKKDAALFNKQLHVVQSDWNYLTTNA